MKILGKILLLLIVAAAIFIAIEEKRNYDLQKLNASVILSAELEPRCGLQTPVRINVLNSSQKVLVNVKYSVAYFEPGYSKARGDFYGESDKIIPAGKSFSFCAVRAAYDHDPIPITVPLEFRAYTNYTDFQ